METIPTIIIDKFFETPSLVRQYALGLDFYKGDRGNWPGTRTDFIDKLNPELFEVVAKNLIKYLKGYTGFSELQTSFQLVTKIHEKGWIHTDDTKFNVGAVIFLNPDSPVDSGFSVFDMPNYAGDAYWNQHNKLKEECLSKFKEQVKSEDSEEIKKYVEYRDLHNSSYTENISIQNRFNRALIFSSSQCHSAQNFFGDGKDDARLTLVCFGRAV
jgi:hypothetical protein